MGKCISELLPNMPFLPTEAVLIVTSDGHSCFQEQAGDSTEHVTSGLVAGVGGGEVGSVCPPKASANQSLPYENLGPVLVDWTF